MRVGCSETKDITQSMRFPSLLVLLNYLSDEYVLQEAKIPRCAKTRLHLLQRENFH